MGEVIEFPAQRRGNRAWALMVLAHRDWWVDVQDGPFTLRVAAAFLGEEAQTDTEVYLREAGL